MIGKPTPGGWGDLGFVNKRNNRKAKLLQPAGRCGSVDGAVWALPPPQRLRRIITALSVRVPINDDADDGVLLCVYFAFLQFFNGARILLLPNVIYF